MKAIAINASPMRDRGNTAAVLNPFIDGMNELGAQVDIFYTKNLNIKPCKGEYSCQIKTPGSCFQHDDMDILLPLISEADIHVYATPLYVDGFAGTLKMVFDRTIPLLSRSIELRDGHCRHPTIRIKKNSKVVLVSSCSFWEIDNFDPLLEHMKAICRNMDYEFCGALLRPHAPAFKAMASKGAPVNDILDAAKEAGRQLIKEGKISSNQFNIVSRPLMPLEEYIKIANQNHQKELSTIGRQEMYCNLLDKKKV